MDVSSRVRQLLELGMVITALFHRRLPKKKAREKACKSRKSRIFRDDRVLPCVTRRVKLQVPPFVTKSDVERTQWHPPKPHPRQTLPIRTQQLSKGKATGVTVILLQLRSRNFEKRGEDAKWGLQNRPTVGDYF